MKEQDFPKIYKFLKSEKALTGGPLKPFGDGFPLLPGGPFREKTMII